jgi:xylan 1,4-beta-xylosidase
MRVAFYLVLLLGQTALGGSSEPLVLKVDFGRTNGAFRALHGINKGPLVAGGMLDITAEQRALGLPFIRLHDCHWPNPDVVDIHAVFPNPNADAQNPSSYDFAQSDDYLQAASQTGAKLIYRLGESIEHTRVKRFVHPPRDTEHWSKVCLGIIRHYNEGWANGFHMAIPYWEIWNEPENRPAMWSGSDEDYLRLYKTAAQRIKAAYPKLKLGGPAVGFSGQFKNGQFEPSPFVLAFLEMCRREAVPLDFFSWHCYTSDPSELARRSQAIRRLLDSKGFTSTESHLNEWNYLPGNSWKPLSKTAAPEAREKYYAQMAGPAGAAFIATALLELQDAPVDVCNLFHGETGGFGIFSENGLPYPNYYAVLAIHRLIHNHQRVWTEGSVPGRIGVAAGSGKEGAVLVAVNYASENTQVRLELANPPWGESSSYTLFRLNSEHKLAPMEKGRASHTLTFPWKQSEVDLIVFEPANP